MADVRGEASVRRALKVTEAKDFSVGLDVEAQKANRLCQEGDFEGAQIHLDFVFAYADNLRSLLSDLQSK